MKLIKPNGVENENIGQTGLSGKLMIKENEGLNAIVYDITLDKNAELTPFKMGYHHIYYCMAGEATIVINGSPIEFRSDEVLALPAGTNAMLDVPKSVRLLAVYPKIVDSASQPDMVYSKLSDVIGSSRDVDALTAQSRRFLLQGDHFNITMTNTQIPPDSLYSLQYRNHIEACYYIKGNGTYWVTSEDDSDKTGYPFNPQEDGGGSMLFLNKHDKHEIDNRKGEDANCICMFYPPLTGHEKHNASTQFSCY